MPHASEMKAAYSAHFYEVQRDRSRTSAERIIPIIIDAVAPVSMIDIGCGVGYWPTVFQQHGVAVAHGIDGPWARQGGLVLAADAFVEFDFEKAAVPYRPALPQPRYDLVTSFEFAEHIDPKYADALVDLFCDLSDVVVCGAAIPYQGGAHHVNERWPDYWADKFRARGYEPCDFIRPQVWNSPEVEPWYAQNSIAYFKGGVPDRVRAAAEKAWGGFAGRTVALAHPDLWTAKSINEQAPPPGPARRLIEKVKRKLDR